MSAVRLAARRRLHGVRRGAPGLTTHSAVAGRYAHATAPLRRLADRSVLQTCVALHAGEPVPADVRAALPRLPAVMAGADRAAHALDRAGIDLAEAAVRARCDAPDLPLGATLDVVLVPADPASRTVLFRPG